MIRVRWMWVILAVIAMAGCAGGGGVQDRNAISKQNALRAKAHTELGAAYFQENQLEIALDEFNQAIEADAGYALAYSGLGLVYAKLGEDAKAEMNFKKSVQIDPNSSESQNNYGSFLCSRNRIDESVARFMESVKNPLYATPEVAYLNAGICTLKKNDEKNAEPFFRKALQIDPLFHRAAFNLAQIQFKQHRLEDARSTLQTAIFRQPSPEMLWLGIQIERGLGNRDAEASYSLELRNRYPDSPQTQLLLNGK